MSTLQAELNRLYRCREGDGSNAAHAADLLVADGHVRALVLELARPADWSALSVLWRGVQSDLQWPAPAIAVSGVDAYQLWFALAEPVTVPDAQAVLQALCARYLGTVAPARMRLFPQAGTPWIPRDVPAVQPETQLWSAFVAPDLASIFAEEPWLDVPPSPEAQATLLAQLQCIKPAALRAVLAPTPPAGKPSANHDQRDPKSFLQAVMADTGLDMRLRVDAAIALLPYCTGAGG